jgi:hypothetical protein
LPGDCFIELGYGDVEALAKLIFHGADDLAPVFEGPGVFDAKLEGELGDGHDGRESTGCILRPSLDEVKRGRWIASHR